jgi:hypothetical protein
MDKNYTNLPIPAEIYDEMGIDENTPLQFDYDPESRTLRIHVLSEGELETLAGHCADRCEDCLWVETCEDAHGGLTACTDFVEREGDNW